MKKFLVFAVFLVLMSNLYGDDEDLPQSDCFNNSAFQNYGSILINAMADTVDSGTNFVEKELMKRQPDKIWPVKNASSTSITHSKADYLEIFGFAEQNSFTVQNAWLHSSWNTRIIKYGLNEEYYHSAMVINIPFVGLKNCNNPWTTVEQAKRWAKWFTHGHEYYDAGIPNFDYIDAANTALANGELNTNLFGTFFPYNEDYELVSVDGNMTPNFPDRVRWNMKKSNGNEIVMLKYHDKGPGTVDTWNDFNNNQVGRAIGECQCEKDDNGNFGCPIGEIEPENTDNCESNIFSTCHKYLSKDNKIRLAHKNKCRNVRWFADPSNRSKCGDIDSVDPIGECKNSKMMRTKFVSDIEKLRAAYNTEQNPLNAPLYYECANSQPIEAKDENGDSILNDEGKQVYWGDCDLDGIIDAYDPCPQLCDIRKNGHSGEFINEYVPEPDDNNTYEIFHQNGNNFYMHCNETVFPICDEYGNEAGEANNISSGCDDGCEGCFSCEEEDSELLCFENGQQIADYEGLCMGEQKEYRCSGGKAEINGEIDIFIPGCSYPGCIPPWLNGFFNPAEEEFNKVGGPVWEGMLSESVVHTMEHTYQIANSFEKSYSVVKDANGSYGLYLNEFGTWVKISDVSNYPEIGRSSTLIADNVIIFAGGESINGTASNKVYALNIGSQSQTQYKTMLYSNNFVEIATLPNISNISMAVVNGYLYLMGNGSQNFHLYRLEENGFTLLDNSLPKRINYSVTSDSCDIYIAGGFKCLSCGCGEKNYRDIIKFSPSNLSWTTIADKIRTDLTNVPMFKVDNKIYLANPRFRNDGKIRRIVVDILTGEITTDYKIPSKPNVFCLGEESSTVFGGRELSGVCTAFTEKEFESIPMGTTVKTLAGLGNKLAIGTGSQVKIYDVANPLSPILLHTKGIYGPASDMLVYGNKLIVAVENGIDTIDLTTFEYTHKATYGSTKALRMYNGKLYLGDGQGIKVLNPDTLEILQQLNTSGDVKKLEIIEDVVYCYEWVGLKRFNVETLSQITTNSFNPSISEMRTYNGNLYIAISDYIQKLTFNGSSVVTANLIGDKVDLRNTYTTGYYTYFPSGNNLRVSTMEEIPEPVCGNGIIEEGELCDGNSAACTTLSDDYVDGTAYCNSTCNGYDETNCEEDGW